MKTIFSIVLTATLLISLNGCSWLVGDDGMLRDRKNDYLEETVLPELNVPDGLADYEEDELFLIPDARNKNLPAEDFEVPRPAPLANAGSGNMVRIQKLSGDIWLLIDVPPSHLWQRIKNFLVGNRIPLAREDAPQGLLETSWLQRTDVGEGEQPANSERYLYRIDQGVQRNSSEVHIVQYQSSALDSLPTAVDWPQASVSVEREEWMVRELANYLANSEERGSVSLLAQGIGSASKVSLGRDASGAPVVSLGLPFDRAWASVGQALGKAEFEVDDLDRSKGHYFVRAQAAEKTEKKRGLFGRMFASGKESEGNKEYLLTVVNESNASAPVAEQGLDSSVDGVEIRILEKPGQPAIEKKEARALLERLKGFLS